MFWFFARKDAKTQKRKEIKPVTWVYKSNCYFYKSLQIKVMRKYYFTIALILFLVVGLASCSNEENKTQNEVASRPTVPILDWTVTDVDGNIYKIVTIGNQKWTKANLNVSRYRNGDPIPQVTDPTQWANLTTGAWCYYNNDSANGPIYGKLYNWYAVNDSRGLAPVGWHVPSDTEWTILTTFLGGESVAGGKMKEMGIANWLSPNTSATNSSGFKGLPGGLRYYNGSFDYVRNVGLWWSSSERDIDYIWYRYLSNNFASVERLGSLNKNGISIRCLRD
jgi:uncharacterized protein (TIGR02145 family)